MLSDVPALWRADHFQAPSAAFDDRRAQKNVAVIFYEFLLNSYVVLISVEFLFQKDRRLQWKSEEKWTETLCGHYFLHLICGRILLRELRPHVGPKQEEE